MPVNLRSSAAAVGFLAVGAFLFCGGYLQIFTRFAPYDDEGYLMISLRSFLSGVPLYEELYTQYGPAYYQFFGAVFRLFDMPVDHDHGRLVSLSCWSLSGALSVLVASLGAAPRLNRAGGAVAGVMVALLALTKINVGLFAVLSFTLVAACLSPWLKKRPLIAYAAVLVHGAVPFALIGSMLSEPWSFRYALLVSSAIVLLGVALVRQNSPLPSTLVVAAGVSFLATALLVLSTAIIEGTTLMGLARGIIFDPIRHPGIYSIPLFLLPHPIELFSGALLLCALAWRRLGVTERTGELAEGIWRLVLGAVIMYSASGIGPAWHFQFTLVPLLWLVAFAPTGSAGPPALASGRSLLPAVAVFQTLHAYPVAATQIVLSAFLLVPAGAICVADGLGQIQRASGEVRTIAIRAFSAAALIGAVGLSAWRVREYLQPDLALYGRTRSARLSGAQRLRLPHPQAEHLEWVTEAVRQQCSTFLTYPGMNSFYLWSQLPPPSYINVGAWMYLLDDQAQRSIVEAARARSRLCLVRAVPVVQVWARGRPLPRGPLDFYLERGFVPYGKRGHYELLVKAPARDEAGQR
jgi:hypothetical protein